MKLVVFGATGTVGNVLVKQALAAGHQVTAFARHPEVLAGTDRNLTRRPGDVLDPAAVNRAVRGQDAVLVVLGAGRKGGVRAAGTENIVQAMKAEGVERLICMSTLGAGDSAPLLTFFWKYIMFGLLLKDALADHEEQERTVRESGLDWTIVRPGAFANGEPTGVYRHGFSADTKGLKLKISRADLAEFLLRQVTDMTYLKQAPGISY